MQTENHGLKIAIKELAAGLRSVTNGKLTVKEAKSDQARNEALISLENRTRDLEEAETYFEAQLKLEKERQTSAAAEPPAAAAEPPPEADPPTEPADLPTDPPPEDSDLPAEADLIQMTTERIHEAILQIVKDTDTETWERYEKEAAMISEETPAADALTEKGKLLEELIGKEKYIDILEEAITGDAVHTDTKEPEKIEIDKERVDTSKEKSHVIISESDFKKYFRPATELTEQLNWNKENTPIPELDIRKESSTLTDIFKYFARFTRWVTRRKQVRFTTGTANRYPLYKLGDTEESRKSTDEQKAEIDAILSRVNTDEKSTPFSPGENVIFIGDGSNDFEKFERFKIIAFGIKDHGQFPVGGVMMERAGMPASQK